MLKSVVSAFLVFRLEWRSPSPLDATVILLEWLHRPVIEIVFQRPESREDVLTTRLNEVYPF